MDRTNTAASNAPILALMGSPRRNGNTSILLNAVLKGIAGVDYDEIVLRDLKISPCLEIYQCKNNGQCAIKDDMTVLYDKLVVARVVILASPVFFYGPSAQAKAAIDRCQALWSRKYLLGQKNEGPKGMGVLLSVGATAGKKLFDGMMLTAKYFFDVLELDFSESLLVRKVDEAGELAARPEVLEEARELGRKLADFVLAETNGPTV